MRAAEIRVLSLTFSACVFVFLRFCSCLNNGERIKLRDTLTMVFEVEDLAVASPATVSRCGMVYLEASSLGWEALIDTWRPQIEALLPERAEFIVGVLKHHIPPILAFLRAECKQMIAAVDNNLVRSCITLLQALVRNVKQASEADSETGGIADEDINSVMSCQLFTAMVWSFGANVHDSSRAAFSNFLRAQVQTSLAPSLSLDGDVFDYFYDVSSLRWVNWTARVPAFKYDPAEAYFNILVPTAETVKYTYFLDTLVGAERNVLMLGESGVSKTSIIQDFLKAASVERKGSVHSFGGGSATTPGGGFHSVVPVSVLLSAQTSAHNLQDMFESKLEKKRKNLLGAPVGKRVVVFVDDLNMPQREVYGASPPIELLRQTMDAAMGGGFYNRSKLFFTKVQDALFIGACAPPGGGRNPVTQRLTRHFHHIWQPLLSDASLRKIFTSILGGFLTVTAASHWVNINVEAIAASLVDTTVDVYNQLRKYMLPTPAKSHYTYNLRDLSKVIQGICQISRKHLPDLTALLRLWLHEAARSFRDRLVDDADRGWFNRLCASRIAATFEAQWAVDDFKDLCFADLVESNAEDRDYREHNQPDRLVKILEDQLAEYNLMVSNPMQLVFFASAVQHLTRISRILRQPRGNALLIGVGGSGRQSLTRLASFIAGYKCVSVEMTRGFGEQDWKDQLKRLLETAGCENKPVVFLLSDSSIVKESFLEDVNSLLNAGEVPNLFEAEELEQIAVRVRPLAKSAGKGDGRDAILAYFVQLVRENLHIVLAFSPIGDTLRTRCRRYPALVNTCTIDFFDAWSADALYSVAERFLSAKELGLDAVRGELCKLCVRIHTSVNDISARYFKELRRYNYVTPTSYLELLKLYAGMLVDQRDAVTKRIVKYRSGLSKLQQTNRMVEELQVDLVKLQPILTKSSAEVAVLLVELEKDQAEASETAAVCAADAEQCAETTRQVQLIANECQIDLDEAMPAYEAAIRQLDTLDKSHITILKSFQHPPQPVRKTMEAVLCLMGSAKTDWDTAKRVLNRTDFLKEVKAFDKDNISKKTLKALQKYLQDPEFTSEALASVSEAAVSLCMWVRAMDTVSGNRDSTIKMRSSCFTRDFLLAWSSNIHCVRCACVFCVSSTVA
jgi:dynein heavy chain